MDLPILLGRIKKLLAFNVVDTALSVGTLLIAATVGLVEAAGSRIAYSLLWFVLYAFWLHKLVGFRWVAMLKNYGMSLVLTAATVAPAALAVWVWRTPATLSIGEAARDRHGCGRLLARRDRRVRPSGARRPPCPSTPCNGPNPPAAAPRQARVKIAYLILAHDKPRQLERGSRRGCARAIHAPRSSSTSTAASRSGASAARSRFQPAHA